MRQGRSRAVSLTPEGVERVQRTVVARWRQSGTPQRLTRERRAAIMGVSVVTANRLLAGEGVDRATLILVFQRLGLDWREDYCQRAADPPASEPGISSAPATGGRPLELAASEATPVNPSPPAAGSGNVQPRVGMGAWVLTGTLALALALWPLWASLRPAPKAFEGVQVRPDSALRTNVATTKAKPADPVWYRTFDYDLYLALQAFNQGEYVEARIRLDRAMRLAGEKQSSRSMDIAFKLSGELAEVRGEFALAEEHYRASIRGRELLRLDPWPVVHENLGVLLTRRRQFEEARFHLLMAEMWFQRTNQPKGVAGSLRNLGTWAYEQNKWDLADTYFERALAILRTNPEPDMVADIRSRQGLVMLDRDDPAAARTRFREILAHWTAKQHPRWMAQTELRLGLAERALGNEAEGRRLLQQSLRRYQSVGAHKMVKQVEQHLLAGNPPRPRSQDRLSSTR